MKNTHQHWRALNLTIPVNGYDDPWIAGRGLLQISRDLMDLLGEECGLSEVGVGSNTSANGSPGELSIHYYYEDLRTAVLGFESVWREMKFPNRTNLRHVERFPDCSFISHVLIRWVDGKMDPFSTELTNEVLLGPHNA